MILLSVHYHTKNDKRCEFLQQVQECGIIEASKEEEGNLAYEYSLPLENPDTVCLFEIWQDEASQKAHGETAHYKKLSKLKNEFVESTEICRYEARLI